MPPLPVTEAIKESFAGRNANSPDSAPEVAAFYEAQRFAPLWLDDAGRPDADAQVALKLLLNASLEGLDPADYDAERLMKQASVLATGSVDTTDAASFDTGLTEATLLYLRHLHHGRVSPKVLGYKLAGRADEHNFPALLRTAVHAHNLDSEAASLMPQLDLYKNLKARLTEYRALANDPALTPLPAISASVKPGESYEGAVALHRLLVALGDVPETVPAPTTGLYSEELAEGVKRFQERHGIKADGVLGKGTMANLQVPMSDRVRQIELSLERLRWLPHLGDGPLIAVNIPMFRMWAWNSLEQNRTPDLEMGVIVGQALRNETPVFIEDMKFVTFRPYWNVPASIVKAEILPAIKKNPGYLERNDMELVSGQSDAAKPVPASAQNLERLENGQLRLRQRPGERNSLGLMKFVFPNDENVYMHGTPAPALFARDRRDFSHGCIRVEDPVALAEWVLKGQGVDRDQVIRATQGKEPKTMTLDQPVQVVLFYLTAAVTPDGQLHFADDIYKEDAALDRALSD